MSLQVSLLRVLDNKEVVRIGEAKPRPVDFRLLSASNKDLKQLVADGRFREDLYYRIRGLDIRMPPLRERREDIPLLAEHFARIDSLVKRSEPPRFTKDATVALMRHPWPGNVRELRSAVSFAVLQSSRGIVRFADLPPEIILGGRQPPPAPAAAASSNGPRAETTKQTVLNALKEAKGNRSRAAKLLGISRATFYRRLRQVGIGRE
jgi:transcriptional regulator of acetoin/glycerol metabolism